MQTKGKLVVLKLDGNLEQQGFRVALEIGTEGDRPLIETMGALPPDPELVTHLNQWQQAYRRLGSVNRIMPQEIIYGGSVNRLEDCKQAARQLRDCLNNWLESPSFRPVDRRLREALSVDEPIKILIRAQNVDVRRLPWHLWDFVEHYSRSEVALGALTTERLVTTATRPQETVRILAILGSHVGIDIEADRRVLEQLPNAEVTFLVEPARRQLNQQLWDKPWDILFFAGHSQTENNQGRIYLNARESLTLEELKYGLRQAIAQGLQLAIFNSCDGLGLAYELEQLHLPQLIVMREPVPDPVAQEFLKYFLTALSQGELLYLAARQARERLQGLEGEFPCASWLPAIHQSVMDSPLRWRPLGTESDDSASLQTNAPALASGLAQQHRYNLPSALIVCLLTAAVVIGARQLGVLQRLELQAYDQLQRLHLMDAPRQRLLIVEATETDIKTYGYPLPDAVVAQAIEQLERHRPRVIALDIFRSRKAVSQDDRLPNRKTLQSYLLRQPNLITLCSIRHADDPNRPGIDPPLEVPEERLGFSNVVIDPDGVLRRHLLFMQPDPQDPCATRLSLSAAVALQYLQTEGIQPQNLDQHQVQIGKAIFMPLESDAGAYRSLDSWGFQMMLNYAPLEQFARRISFSDLLHNRVQLSDLQHHAVLIGVVAPISNPTDEFLTPESSGKAVYETTPGVRIQAQMVHQIVSAALGERVIIKPMPNWGDVIWIVSWSFIGGSIAWRFRRLQLWSLIVGICVLVLYGICWSLLIVGFWMPLLPSLLVMVLSSTGVITFAKLPNRQAQLQEHKQ